MLEIVLAAIALEAAVPRPEQDCDRMYQRELTEDIDGANGILRVHLVGRTCQSGVIYFEAITGEGNTDLLSYTAASGLLRSSDRSTEDISERLAFHGDVRHHDDQLPRTASQLPAPGERFGPTGECFYPIWTDRVERARELDLPLLFIPLNALGDLYVFVFDSGYQAYTPIGASDTHRACQLFED
ncbi:hypothetical protein NHF40_03785 [Maricaulaceae bacterium EIL42A08]|nr:hypothetical protein [Maricaulaceae bacterium EIL42A08]